MTKNRLRIYSPVRANLLGGWTDQEMWPEMAAVSNVAIGWPGCFEGHYPLMLVVDGKLRSKIEGYGSGLGISSIMLALKEIQRNPSIIGDDLVAVILKVLEEERAISQGGWQDQVGGIVPGFKLTVTCDHQRFSIRRRDYHPALEHMVLFDSGVRRPSAGIGDRIRTLIESGDREFMAHMRWIAYQAIETFDHTQPMPLIEATIESWRKFVEFVPKMRIPLPLPKIKDKVVGSFHTGAGGGGFGITWVNNPGYKDEVVERYKRAGIWAIVPQVINSGPYIVEC